MNKTVKAGDDPSPAHIAVALRERIYGTIACLSSLIVLSHDEHATAWSAIFNVAIAAGGLWGAALLAELVAHTGVHGNFPTLSEARHMFSSTIQIMVAVVTPVFVLTLSGLGVLKLERAFTINIVLLEVTLGIFAFLAVMRTKLSWWGKVVVVVAEMGLGAVVIVLKTLAH